MTTVLTGSFWPLWFVDWIVRPHAMVRGVLAKPERWMVGFGAILISGLALHIYYHVTVDYTWLQSSTIASAKVALTDDQKEIVRNFMNPRTLLIVGGAALVIQHVLVLGVLVGYFKLVSVMALVNVPTLQLLALASWVRVPLIFDDMAAAWRWSQASPQTLSFDTLSPLNAGNLFPALADTALAGFSLMWLWILVLMAAGIRYLMGMAWPIGIIAAIFPFALFITVHQLVISLV